MTDVLVLNEPTLEFRYGQSLVDPHDGLYAFGPYDADLPSRPRGVTVAGIGTKNGLRRLQAFSETVQGPVAGGEDKRLWPSFPGFEAVFGSPWPSHPSWTEMLDEQRLADAAHLREPNERVHAVADFYINAMEVIAKRDEHFSLILCVVPDFVFKYCRPQSRVDHPTGDAISASRVTQRKAGQLEIFESWDPDLYEFSLDFRNQIKARALAFEPPIQIILESTLQTGGAETRRERQLTPLSDRAWNLMTTAYYKAGGKPWRLVGAREGVCYVGIAYRRRDPSADSRSACCAAQMFLDSGDGIVFMGETGAWYSPERKQFHLDPVAARNLLDGVLATYSEMHGKPLTEVFLHSNSGIDRDEFAGFQSACPAGVKLVGVRVRREMRWPVKLFREGTRPVLRGTFWQVDERSGYLWGSGYKPRLETYDGMETPLPLRIDVQHGEADVIRVATDILGLTKLNYNACKLGDGEPVTVGFSKAVGEILVSNPAVKQARPQFKYYI